MAENKITKGEKYLCIKTVRSIVLGNILFKKGRIYTSSSNNTLDSDEYPKVYITGNVIVDWFDRFEKI